MSKRFFQALAALGPLIVVLLTRSEARSEDTCLIDLRGEVKTAKANGIEPYAYLRRVFAKLPSATTLENIEALLRDRVDQEQLGIAFTP